MVRMAVAKLLFDSHFVSVEASLTGATSLLQEFPSWFVEHNFHHDARYEYKSEFDYESGEYVYFVVDKGYGWWYPEEPQSGYHGW